MISRRQWLTRGSLAAAASTLAGPLAAASPTLRLATFRADVTPPLGHPLMGGGIEPARSVADPLEAVGIVLVGPDPPIVLVAVDWCEIRGEAHDAWRRRLAEAAGTSPSRVLVSAVHQHDAPLADYAAERLLRDANAAGRVCDPTFCEEGIGRAERALRGALTEAQPLTHVATSRARVERIASNRRYLTSEGDVRFDRTSATRDPQAQAAPEGAIDPWLRSLELWSGEQRVAALHAYAVHPMSYYGRGDVSADFVGSARRTLEREQPGVTHLYFSGASGNVTAGKYNDGASENRARLAERLAAAMRATTNGTSARQRLERVDFRAVEARLPVRDDPGFSEDELQQRLRGNARPFGQCLAALGLSRRERIASGTPIDVPLVDFGPAQLVLLPGEAYVEYQLRANDLRPDSTVLTAGYGEAGCGYVPTEAARREGDTNLGEWCWNGPGSEAALTDALRALLAPR